MKKLSRLLLLCIVSVGGQTIDLNAQEYETIDESVFDEETVKGLKAIHPMELVTTSQTRLVYGKQ